MKTFKSQKQNLNQSKSEVINKLMKKHLSKDNVSSFCHSCIPQ